MNRERELYKLVQGTLILLMYGQDMNELGWQTLEPLPSKTTICFNFNV